MLDFENIGLQTTPERDKQNQLILRGLNPFVKFLYFFFRSNEHLATNIPNLDFNTTVLGLYILYSYFKLDIQKMKYFTKQNVTIIL